MLKYPLTGISTETVNIDKSLSLVMAKLFKNSNCNIIFMLVYTARLVGIFLSFVNSKLKSAENMKHASMNDFHNMERQNDIF